MTAGNLHKKKAIHLAESGEWETLEILLQMESSHAKERDRFGMLPLHWACTDPSIPFHIFKFILDTHPEGCRTKNNSQMLPLHVAIRSNMPLSHVELLQNLYPEAATEEKTTETTSLEETCLHSEPENLENIDKNRKTMLSPSYSSTSSSTTLSFKSKEKEKKRRERISTFIENNNKDNYVRQIDPMLANASEILRDYEDNNKHIIATKLKMKERNYQVTTEKKKEKETENLPEQDDTSIYKMENISKNISLLVKQLEELNRNLRDKTKYDKNKLNLNKNTIGHLEERKDSVTSSNPSTCPLTSVSSQTSINHNCYIIDDMGHIIEKKFPSNEYDIIWFKKNLRISFIQLNDKNYGAKVGKVSCKLHQKWKRSILPSSSVKGIENVQVGDHLISINNKDVQKVCLSEIIELLRLEPKPVRLRFHRLYPISIKHNANRIFSRRAMNTTCSTTSFNSCNNISNISNNTCCHSTTISDNQNQTVLNNTNNDIEVWSQEKDSIHSQLLILLGQTLSQCHLLESKFIENSYENGTLGFISQSGYDYMDDL